MMHTLQALTALAAFAGADPHPLAIGDPIPLADVKMKNIDGKELTLAKAAGPKGTLVIFSCNHCPYVKAWEDRLVAIGNEYRKKGIGVVAVNPNDPKAIDEDKFENMVERARQRKMEFPYVVDATSNLARTFGATKTPESFLFDQNGKLIYHGAIDDNYSDPTRVTHHYLRDAIDAHLSGKPVPVAETKAFGCGVKLRPTT